jgi:hypothetical protein
VGGSSQLDQFSPPVASATPGVPLERPTNLPANLDNVLRDPKAMKEIGAMIAQFQAGLNPAPANQGQNNTPSASPIDPDSVQIMRC